MNLNLQISKMIFLFLYLKNRILSCQFGDEICECRGTQMKCMTFSQSFMTLLDMDLLSYKTSINTTFIQNKNVTTIKSFKTFAILVLIINNNKIGFLNKSSFEGMTSLEILNVTNDQLDNIESYTFHSLFKLKNLSLYSNNLKVLKEFTFWNLTILETLNLYDNEIETIQTNAFYHLKSLRYLQPKRVKTSPGAIGPRRP